MQGTIAIVGNPNSGKTTLFNALTGSTQRVGNWAGVTVEKKTGYYSIGDNKIEIVDLPGIYALSASSEDEKIALEYILSGEMDLILNIIDGTNLERNLYLTFQLIELGVPLVVAVNMLDIAESRKITIDLTELSKMLGVPVYGISAKYKGDAHTLKGNLAFQLKKKPVSSLSMTYPLELRQWVDVNSSLFGKTAAQFNVNTDWVALQALEGNNFVINAAQNNGESIEQIANFIQGIELGDTPEIMIAESRYKLASSIKSIVTKAPTERSSISEKVDKVVLNRVLGIPIFLFFMYLVFWATQVIGGAFIDFFDITFGAIFVDGLGVLLASISTPEWLISIVTGIGAGIQTVSTFVPIVFMMFVCLAILEDSGYMARAAFVMDRFMRAIGLPGKSFIPMLVGFGCTVPAVIASRTLESTRDRILTIFMVPFMSCGARLPVYALFGAAFFGAKAGLMVFSIYLMGGILAIFTGLLMKNTLLKGTPSFFVMELPPYHTPRIGIVLRHAWNRAKAFVFRAGKVIIISVALLGLLNSIGTDGSFGNEDAEKSLLSAIGVGITPVFGPMGIEEDNWAATVALFTGLFAKEAVVGTLNSLYAQVDGIEHDIEEGEFSLSASMMEALKTIPDNLMSIVDGFSDPLGLGVIGADEAAVADGIEADKSIFASMRAHFTHGYAQVYAYLMFILLYIPCLAAMGAVVREIGAKLGIVLAVYLALLAWIVSTLIYQIGSAHQAVWIAVPLVMLALIAFALRLLGGNEIG